MKRIRSIFVATAPPPPDSPYYELARQWKVEIVFANLIETQGYTLSEFREQGLSPLDFKGFIFSSKQAVDHFFRLMAEMRLELPAESRFLCTGEIVGQQVYQYVQGPMRRRIYAQATSLLGLIPYMRKYPDIKYLYVGGGAAPLQFFEEAQRYKLDLSTVKVYHVHYVALPPALKRRRFSVLCFPTPTSVMGWFYNHPKFQQKGTLVLVYGEDTQRVAEGYGLKIHDYAPRAEVPSLLALLRHLLRSQE
jgi:uroporphyrinogen-III synthase